MTRTALITGGGSGIGLAIAQQLALEGIAVTVTGRNEDRLKDSGFDYVVMDVTDEASVNRTFADKDPFDIVVSNAGAAKTAPAMKTSLDLWQDMIAVNMTGAFLCAKAALPAMAEKRYGRFIVVASTSALKAYPYTMAYTASKHGALGLVRSLAAEFATTGVTCNAVCPGFTDTEIVSASIRNVMEKTGRSESEARQAFVKDNPMKRLVSPAEVASAVSWLCSDGAAAVNGQSIIIDGGELVT